MFGIKNLKNTLIQDLNEKFLILCKNILEVKVDKNDFLRKEAEIRELQGQIKDLKNLVNETRNHLAARIVNERIPYGSNFREPEIQIYRLDNKIINCSVFISDMELRIAIMDRQELRLIEKISGDILMELKDFIK